MYIFQISRLDLILHTDTNHELQNIIYRVLKIDFIIYR